MMISECYVWKWLEDMTEPVVAGKLKLLDSGEYIFAYGKSYLNRENAEPVYIHELPLKRGEQSPFAGLAEFACLRDASPDAWGRRVINNRLFASGNFHDIQNMDGPFQERELSEMLYFLESSSDRVGSLDFQESSSVYVPRDQQEASIDELFLVSQKIANNEPIPDNLKMALMHGTALGGARPKSMLNGSHTKYIVKFSTSEDSYDIVKSEYIAMKLASCVGINVAPVSIGKVLDRDYLLVERFDRVHKGEGKFARKSLVSALTVLKLHEFWVREASYEDLVEEMRKDSKAFQPQAQELFRRMVFNVLVGNTDDHPRNHSFFVEGGTITLTPAYDICPQPRTGGEASHGMKINGQSRASTLANVLAVSERFTFKPHEATQIIESMVKSVRDGFEDIADECALPLTSKNLLLSGPILNKHIFYGGFEHLLV